MAALAYSAFLWVPLVWGESGSRPIGVLLDRLFDRFLRTLLVRYSYKDVRQLALYLQDVVPTHRVPLESMETRMWRVRAAGDRDLFLQLFKTAINDARLALLPYALEVPNPVPSAGVDLEQVAQALAGAIRSYQRHANPATTGDHPNPLRDAILFNEERFLAALWRSYRRSYLATAASDVGEGSAVKGASAQPISPS